MGLPGSDVTCLSRRSRKTGRRGASLPPSCRPRTLPLPESNVSRVSRSTSPRVRPSSPPTQGSAPTPLANNGSFPTRASRGAWLAPAVWAYPIRCLSPPPPGSCLPSPPWSTSS